MGKLDIEKFDADVKDFTLKFVDILKDKSRKRLKDHIELALEAPNRLYEDHLFAAPSVFSLFIYGEAGLEALYDIANKKYGRLDCIFDAQRALIYVAVGSLKPFVTGLIGLNKYLTDEQYDEIIDIIENNFNNAALVEKANIKLSQLVFYYMSDYENQWELSNLFDMATFPMADKEVGSIAIDLILKYVSKHTLKINDVLCDKLISLLAEKHTESTYQKFFERNPVLLDPLASSVIKKQPLADKWQTDFVIKRLDDEYVLVEIELPGNKPFTEYPHPTSKLSHAIGQILNWFVWLEDNISYAQKNGFPDIHTPTGVIVIGRTDDLTEEQKRMLKALNDLIKPRITIYTYDDVINNALNVVRNLTEGKSI
jgi:hypothetical protein